MGCVPLEVSVRRQRCVPIGTGRVSRLPTDMRMERFVRIVVTSIVVLIALTTVAAAVVVIAHVSVIIVARETTLVVVTIATAEGR